MLSQSGIARQFGPGCYRGKKATIALYGTGKVTVRAAVLDANAALDACLRAHRYPTRARDTGALVCRQKTGGGGMSNHSYGTADDINWTTNPYGQVLRTDMSPAMVKAICSIRTRSGAQVWNWGGYWDGNKDAMHFELVCTLKDLATGIDPRTVPAAPAYEPAPTTPPATPAPTEGDDEMVRIVRDPRDGGIYKILGKPGVLKVRIPGKGSQVAHAVAELEVDHTGAPLNGRRLDPNRIPDWDGDDLDAIRTV